MSRELIVGLISDTHGLLRPEAVELLKGSDFIVHAGDVGKLEIIGELARLAPVTAVRGNVDTGDWAQALPAKAVLEVGGGTMLYVLHDIADMDLDPAAAGFRPSSPAIPTNPLFGGRPASSTSIRGVQGRGGFRCRSP